MHTIKLNKTTFRWEVKCHRCGSKFMSTDKELALSQYTLHVCKKECGTDDVRD